MLDKLLGKLTFDPLAFARDEPKEQDAILRRVVGLDVSEVDAKRKEAFDRRAMLKKTHGIKFAQLAAMPRHEGAPAAEVPLQDVSNEMLRAEELRAAAEHAEREVEKARAAGEEHERRRIKLSAEIDSLMEQLEAKKSELERTISILKASEGEVTILQAVANGTRGAVPDAAAIRAKLAEVEAANAKVRANQRRAEAEAEVKELEEKIQHENTTIAAADEKKVALLRDAQFPVEGLGLSDDGVTFNGHPFEQAGSAEQVRVSVAIGVALNPQLKVLLIRNGNLLDKDALAAVAAQAEAADMQVWMEYVSEEKDGVAVMMVDGEAQ